MSSRNKERDNPTETLPEVEGYRPVKKTISILIANVWAMLLMAVSGLAGWEAINLLWPSAGYAPLDIIWFILLIVVALVVHELVHGVTWLLLLKKGFRHLRFGVMTGAVYCHIDVPMVKRQYVVGALMPLLLVGVLPWLAGIATGSVLWMALGAIMIGGAAGDLMIVWTIRKEPSDTLVYDHPSEAGCYVYRTLQDTQS